MLNKAICVGIVKCMRVVETALHLDLSNIGTIHMMFYKVTTLSHLHIRGIVQGAKMTLMSLPPHLTGGRGGGTPL